MDIIKAITIVVALAAATIATIELNSDIIKSDRNDEQKTIEKAMRILPER